MYKHFIIQNFYSFVISFIVLSSLISCSTTSTLTDDTTTSTADTSSINGCTNSSANNFDSSATTDNGSCKYSFTLSSLAVSSNGTLDDAYKCETKVNGIEPSIPVAWSNPTDNVGSYAITMIFLVDIELLTIYIEFSVQII